MEKCGRMEEAMKIEGVIFDWAGTTVDDGCFAPVQAFIMALMIQARHLFYGIAMLDKFKGMG